MCTLRSECWDEKIRRRVQEGKQQRKALREAMYPKSTRNMKREIYRKAAKEDLSRWDVRPLGL